MTVLESRRTNSLPAPSDPVPDALESLLCYRTGRVTGQTAALDRQSKKSLLTLAPSQDCCSQPVWQAACRLSFELNSIYCVLTSGPLAG